MVSNKMINTMIDSKYRNKITQLIIHELTEILALYPQYSAAQHLSYLTDKKNAHRMNDDQVLKEIQKYRNKLEDEVIEGEEEYFETELNG